MIAPPRTVVRGSASRATAARPHLYGDTSGGNRPGYKEAAPGDEAEVLYGEVCERLGAKRGVFGADMRVEIIGDGPVTILIDV
jgi:D-tyrosyl-tRNA(Tyr) deacylase